MDLIAVFARTETVDQFSDSRKIGVDCFSIGRFCPMAGGWATKRDDLRRVGGVEPNPRHRGFPSWPKPRGRAGCDEMAAILPGQWSRHVATAKPFLEFWNPGKPELELVKLTRCSSPDFSSL